MLVSLRSLQGGDETTHGVLPLFHICPGENSRLCPQPPPCTGEGAGALVGLGACCGSAAPASAPFHMALPGTQHGQQGLASYSHWMYHALQIALLRRILSRQSSRCPLKFFHFGDTRFPLKCQAKERLKGTMLEPSHFGALQGGHALRQTEGCQQVREQAQPCGSASQLCCRLLARDPSDYHRSTLSSCSLRAAQT